MSTTIVCADAAKAARGGDSDDEGSDAEDFIARPKDCFLLAAQASDEHSVLEVYVYDEDTSNLFGERGLLASARDLAAAPVCFFDFWVVV